MVYSESRSPRGKSAHPEFYTNPTFSVGPNDALNTYNSAYRSDAIPTISGSCSFGYALQHLAPGASGLPYQPMTPTLDYSGFVEPNNQWPTLDSAQFYSGGYQDTPGHSTYHAPILPIQPSGRQGATWTWGALSTGTTFRLGLQSIRPGILGIPKPPGPSPKPQAQPRCHHPHHCRQRR
ncbi:hypothetical protein CIB48_g10145 [Xylaria polymorpha]|nr:hypothetical protein CIB48_g10145 [Xylaria polymorpha]